MIKLTRSSEPQVLIDNKVKWLADLDAAVQQYASYEAIPSDEKKKLVGFYRHPDIKAALNISSHEKCAFCECKPGEAGNIEVEHFEPKSLNHLGTFEWSNLLPCCRKCNSAKGAHNTHSEPIVNPYDQDPDDYFEFEDIDLRPKPGPNYVVAERTIEICDLKGTRLLRPRSVLLVSIRQFLHDLADAMKLLQQATSGQSRAARLRKLNEAITRVENLMLPSESHSSFIRTMVEKDASYQEAKRQIAAAV